MKVGPYEVRGELGQGGMGAVYLAWDPRMKREVAIKALSLESLSDEELLARFQREGEAVARLRHPCIVAVHELLQVDDRVYLVMGRVQGQSLEARIQAEGPLPCAEALELIDRISEALAHAHERGVLHRDLKPANVVVTPEGTPVVLDFGLARSISSERERLTRTGQTLGTPAFMAPEQLSGEPDAVGPATDVYGLGATLYALICGQAPFSGGTLVNTLYQVANEAPSPPSARVAGVPQAVDRLVLSALRKTPRDRYETVSAWLDDLRRVREGQAARGARRGPPSAALLALVGLVAVVVVAVAAWTPSAPSQRSAPSERSAPPTRADPAAQALERLLAARPQLDAVPALAGWLRAHGDHPRAGEARDRLRRHGGQRPILELPSAQSTLVAWIDAQHAATIDFVPGATQIRRWSFEDLTRPRREQRWELSSQDTYCPDLIPLPGGELLVRGRTLIKVGPGPGGIEFGKDAYAEVFSMAVGGEGPEARLYLGFRDAIAVCTATWPPEELERWPIEGALYLRRVTTSSDGDRIAALVRVRPAQNTPDTCVVWDRSGRVLRRWTERFGLRELAFSPDGQTVMIGVRPQALVELDVDSGRSRAFAHQEEVPSTPNGVGYSPDGRWVHVVAKKVRRAEGGAFVTYDAKTAAVRRWVDLRETPVQMSVDRFGNVLIGLRNGAQAYYGEPPRAND